MNKASITENDFIDFLKKMNAEPFLSSWLNEWELYKENLKPKEEVEISTITWGTPKSISVNVSDINDMPESVMVNNVKYIPEQKTESSKEEEKIVISDLHEGINYKKDIDYNFFSSKPIPQEKFSLIIKKIEWIVNHNCAHNDKEPYAQVMYGRKGNITELKTTGDKFEFGNIDNEKELDKLAEKKYTEEQMRKCFWAGWAIINGKPEDKFQDYLKTL